MRSVSNPANGWNSRSSLECRSEASKCELQSIADVAASGTIGRRRLSFRSGLLLGSATIMAYSANAQEAPKPAPLPPLNVETTAKKKAPAKKAAAKKKAAPAQSPAPQAPSAAETVEAAATAAGANPYANPDAPYKVERSGSGKLTEPLVNTPRTVTALPKEVIEDKGVTTFRDLARETPGISIGAAEGGASFGNFFIRGFNARGDIFVDNIRDPGNITREAFGIEQIEIYKGPAGGIGGRGTIGGAVNIITKQADLYHDFYEVETTVGTDSTFRTTIDANQTVTPDFAVRTNLMYNQNDVAGRDFADSERWGGFISATATPSDTLKISLDYYRFRNDATPDWGVPINAATRVPYTENGLPRENWYGQIGLDFFEESSDIGTATIVAKLTDNVTVTNRSRVGTNSLDYVATGATGVNAAGDVTLNHPQRDQTADMFVNQTEVNAKFYTSGWKHTLVAGIEFSREQFERYSYAVTGPNTTSLFNPDPYRNTQFISAKNFVYDAKVNTTGVYVADTIHLTDQWIVNGGVRFDDFERDQVGATAANTAKVEADLWSWHAGIVYKPIPISSFYAAFATAQSPIGSDLDATGAQYNGLSTTLVDVPPQEAESYEIGTKWELFDRRLLATAALFHTHVDNARTNDNVTPTDPSNAFQGEYEVQGVEFGVSGNITNRWSAFGGFVYLDSEVLGSANPLDIGQPLANVPEMQFSLLSKYKLTDRFTIGGQAIYSDKVWAGHLARNQTFRHTVDWWRFDAFAEYQLTDNIEIEVTGLNLTDELYYDAIYQGSGFSFVAPGRAGYVTVKYKY
ncbi:MAG: TonB-dependent siderophore receptor [Sedimentisphaerales bacterium]|nr:TonB-dependent siderophore receptor [Sedimentisphaerales bacterium]